MRKIVFAAALLLLPQSVFAATERMPCKSSEATVIASATYLWVSCPTEGRLMPEGMEVHYQGDKRDFVVRSLKLVPLDGPLGGASGPDPRVAELQAKLAQLKAQLQLLASTL